MLQEMLGFISCLFVVLTTTVRVVTAANCPLPGVTTILNGVTTFTGPCNVPGAILSFGTSGSGGILSFVGIGHNYDSIQMTTGVNGVQLFFGASSAVTLLSGITAIGAVTNIQVSFATGATFTSSSSHCAMFTGAVTQLAFGSASNVWLKCAKHAVYFGPTSSATAVTLQGTGTNVSAGNGFDSIHFAGTANVRIRISYALSTFIAPVGSELANGIVVTPPLASTGSSTLSITLNDCVLSSIAGYGIYVAAFANDVVIVGVGTIIVSGQSNVYLRNVNSTESKPSSISFSQEAEFYMNVVNGLALFQANVKMDNVNGMTASFTDCKFSAFVDGAIVVDISNFILGATSSDVTMSILSCNVYVQGQVTRDRTARMISFGLPLPSSTLTTSTSIAFTVTDTTFFAYSALCILCFEGSVIGATFWFTGSSFTSPVSSLSSYMYTGSASSMTSITMTFASSTFTGAVFNAICLNNTFTPPPLPPATSPAYNIDSLAIHFLDSCDISFGFGLISIAQPIHTVSIVTLGATFRSTASSPATSYIFAQVNTAQVPYDTVYFTLSLSESVFTNIRIFTSYYQLRGGLQYFHTTGTLVYIGANTAAQQPDVISSELVIKALFNHFFTGPQLQTRIQFDGGLSLTSSSLLQFQQCNGSRVTYQGGALLMLAGSVVTVIGANTITQDLAVVISPLSITMYSLGSLIDVAPSVTVAAVRDRFLLQLQPPLGTAASVVVNFSGDMLCRIAGTSSNLAVFVSRTNIRVTSSLLSVAAIDQSIFLTLIASPVTSSRTLITFGIALGTKWLSFDATDSPLYVDSNVAGAAIIGYGSTAMLKGSVQFRNSQISFRPGVIGSAVLRGLGPLTQFQMQLQDSSVSSTSQIMSLSSSVSSVTVIFQRATVEMNGASDPFSFASTLGVVNSTFSFLQCNITAAASNNLFSFVTARNVALTFDGSSSSSQNPSTTMMTLTSLVNGIFVSGSGGSASNFTVTFVNVMISSTLFNVYYSGACVSCGITTYGHVLFNASRNIFAQSSGGFSGSIALLGETTLSSTGLARDSNGNVDGNIVITVSSGDALRFSSSEHTKFLVNTATTGNIVIDGDLNHTTDAVIEISGTLIAQRENLKISGRQFYLSISAATLNVTATATTTATASNVNVYVSLVSPTTTTTTCSSCFSGNVTVSSSTFLLLLLRIANGGGSTINTLPSSNILFDSGIDAALLSANFVSVASSTFSGANIVLLVRHYFNLPTTSIAAVSAATAVYAVNSSLFSFTRMAVLFLDNCGGGGGSGNDASVTLTNIAHIGRIVNTVGYPISLYPTTIIQNFVYVESSFVQHSIVIANSTYNYALGDSGADSTQYKFLELMDTSMQSATRFASSFITISNVHAVFSHYGDINALTTRCVNASSLCSRTATLSLYSVTLACFTIRTLGNLVSLHSYNSTLAVMEGTVITVSGVYMVKGNIAVLVDGPVANVTSFGGGVGSLVVFDHNNLQTNQMLVLTGTTGGILQVRADCGTFGRSTSIGSSNNEAFRAVVPLLLDVLPSAPMCLVGGAASCFATVSGTESQSTSLTAPMHTSSFTRSFVNISETNPTPTPTQSKLAPTLSHSVVSVGENLRNASSMSLSHTTQRTLSNSESKTQRTVSRSRSYRGTLSTETRSASNGECIRSTLLFADAGEKDAQVVLPQLWTMPPDFDASSSSSVVIITSNVPSQLALTNITSSAGASENATTVVASLLTRSVSRSAVLSVSGASPSLAFDMSFRLPQRHPRPLVWSSVRVSLINPQTPIASHWFLTNPSATTMMHSGRPATGWMDPC